MSRADAARRCAGRAHLGDDLVQGRRRGHHRHHGAPWGVAGPDARHEILNETTRAEITTAMLDRLRTHHLTTT
ncbi:hypothetical protein DMA12_14780 [Amycolatopsis balhimycina DSM 5908]|uniref:Uncharacterized protein n=1 Tax=Amycolatopsis balhimycina DSM 5908 TaxID=1081091 RepID=A0A428WP07_AMYBA|nr:hypothetical protein [Amycolatopsis balhimycina]RSM44811.1 hypothetical protein DMA12_14780 [Amycolatopsis balhimycina DSM 5908]